MTLPAAFQSTIVEATRRSSLVQTRAQQLLEQWQAEPRDAMEWMNLLLATERLSKIIAAGQENNVSLLETLDNVNPRSWDDVEDLPCSHEVQKRLAEVMMKEIGIWPDVRVSVSTFRIQCGASSKRMVQSCVAHCLRQGVEVDVSIDDAEFDTCLVNAIDDVSVRSLANWNAERYKPITHSVIFRQESPVVATPIDSSKAKILEEADQHYIARRVNDEVRWILTKIPTAKEAGCDGFASYEEYLQFFFDACDQPWDRIRSAQEKLIDVFNRGQQLRITNADGTDVSMSVADHTFANSVIARNIPGSEFFSGPVKDSVNGRIVAKGSFVYKFRGQSYTMKDIMLDMEQGRVMHADAAEGSDALHMILSAEDDLAKEDKNFEGSRHFGEIGIGTNPFIQKHLSNGLLVEKISGSFHIALGSCYGNSYLGKPTLMANGNSSEVHWDITTMLRDKDGRMELDGHVIQKDGVWLACPHLGISEEDVDVLNRGWLAVPEAEHPKYWRDKLKSQQPDYPTH